MALQKPYQLTQDIKLSDAYFRVVKVTVNLQSSSMRHMNVTVYGYYNQSAREMNENDYFYQDEFLIDTSDYDLHFDNNKNHIQMAYEYLKTTEDFKNAIDV